MPGIEVLIKWWLGLGEGGGLTLRPHSGAERGNSHQLGTA